MEEFFSTQMEENKIETKEVVASGASVVVKPKKTRVRKGYFYEEQEQAVRDYITADNEETKNKIFNSILKPAFTKMVESIIRRYHMYIPDEEFEETFNDTLSYLMTKIMKFKPDMNYKAYSYCGTVCKNYLIYKIAQFTKRQNNNLSYDTMQMDLSNSLRFSYDDKSTQAEMLAELIQNVIRHIEFILKKADENELTANEVKVGQALLALMKNWQEMCDNMGSNKFNKSSFLLYLRETTLLSTKEIRDSMKKYKKCYYILKDRLADENS